MPIHRKLCRASALVIPVVQGDASMLPVQDDRQIALHEQLDEKKGQYHQALQTEKELIMQVSYV